MPFKAGGIGEGLLIKKGETELVIGMPDGTTRSYGLSIGMNSYQIKEK